MNNNQIVDKLNSILISSEILMREIEEERDESLDNLRFDGEEELLTQYYKKVLTSIYRMRNNAAALLLKKDCSCKENSEFIIIDVNGIECNITKQALKNVLQKDYESIITKNSKRNGNETLLQKNDSKKDDIQSKQNIKKKEILKRPETTISKAKEEVHNNKEKQESKKNVDDVAFDESIWDELLLEELPIEENVKKSISEKTPAESADDILDLDLNLDIVVETNKNEQDGKTLKEVKKEPVKTEEKISQEAKDIFDEKLLGEKSELEQKPKIKEETKKFRSNDLFVKKKTEEQEIENHVENTKPRFVTEVSSLDPEELLKQLKASRAEYDKLQLEKEIIDAQENDLKGTVFDLSTGKTKSGSLDIKEATEKIDKVAESIVKTSIKDKLMDIKLDTELENENRIYGIQKESDFKRNKNQFILDEYQLIVNILDDEQNVVRTDTAKLIVAPTTIPETGTKLVTDVCAYLESNGEQHGTVVLPGGKTTIAIRCDDYLVLIRGSWENGEFISTIAIRGSGNNISTEVDKKKIRPNYMKDIGIGHNVLYLDHATIVHIIPISFENTFYGYSEFMAIIMKDYGIDQDAECIIPKAEPEVVIRGERYKFNINCLWDENENLIIQSKIVK